jgi:hypothetical protein
MTTLVKGDEECVSARTDLDAAVRDFNETLSHFTSGVVFQTYETVRGIKFHVSTEILQITRY